MELPSDQQANPALRAQVTGLRGSMMEAARALAELPERFEERPHDTRPALVIRDRETGREAVVSLFAYGEARKLLAALFGPAE